jgi:hypothetical protein
LPDNSIPLAALHQQAGQGVHRVESSIAKTPTAAAAGCLPCTLSLELKPEVSG